MHKKILAGKILKLFIGQKTSKTREEQTRIHIDENGIIGDKFYKQNKDRSILVSSKISYDMTKEQGIQINYGDLKENIIFDFDIYSLKTGSKLYIGESIIEISTKCTICSHLEKINKTLPELLKEHRGFFIKVLKNASISKNDLVYKE